MANRRKKGIKKRRGLRSSKKKMVMVEYYQVPFSLFHLDLMRSGYDPLKDHDVADSFWNVVPPGFYDADSAQPLIKQYLNVVEQRLATIIGRHSLGYWLHAYRRLFPGPIGRNDGESTIHLVRSTFEAAIQKYSMLVPCGGVGFSDAIEPEAIFKGLLTSPANPSLCDALRQKRQLVLTDFDLTNFRELCETERLAYQVWRCGAALRITGKGSGISVDPVHSGGFHDTRSDELDKLVESLDSRQRDFSASATGTSFNPEAKGSGGGGIVLCPVYNAASVSLEGFKKWFAHFKLEVNKDSRSNFLWVPFNLGEYCRAHEPYSSSFEKKHGIPLIWIFAVLCGLLLRVFFLWTKDTRRMLHDWWRAYEGPHTREFVAKALMDCLPLGIQSLNIPLDGNEVDIQAVIHFFEVTESKRAVINLGTRGPLSIFLPFGNDRLFIDYAWIPTILYNLFFDIKPVDENFKGDALEDLVRRGRSVIPVTPCKGLNREERQIVASFEIEDTLVIVECRAFARSFGIETGDPRSIAYRTEKIEKGLRDADEKANWLCSNPKGTNYDIRNFRKVLPVVVTPFVEFIPGTASRYWLTDKLPRVLSPGELRDVLGDAALAKSVATSSNAVIVNV